MSKPSILNTRAYAQQQMTTKVFTDQGFAVINFPCIEIVDVDDSTVPFSQLHKIGAHDAVIFTSQHAVNYAFKISPQWLLPDSAIVIAVGAKTAEVLEQHCQSHIWIPAQHNSQGVIDLLKGLKHYEKIQLISAAHGRQLIQSYAQSNDKQWAQINVYKRQLPQADATTIKKIKHTEQLYILATSVTILTNLKLLLPQTLWRQLLNNKVVCASARIASAAQAMGFAHICNMNTANVATIAAKLQSE
jgi:uroporphyrinogen-III synthase